MVRERDVFGRDEVIRNYQADGTLVWKREYEYDEYGYITKLTNYTSETQKSFINTWTRDEIGRQATLWEDKNANGIFDVGDLKVTLIYDQALNSNYAERIDESVNASGSQGKHHNFYTYDEFGRRASAFADRNGNKQLDGDEAFDKSFYHGTTSVIDILERYLGGDKPEQLREIRKFIYQDVGVSGAQVAVLAENVATNDVTLGYGVAGFHYSSKDDYTSEKWSALLDGYVGKINQINLTNARANTEITLDNDVVAKIAKDATLRINGDATDTVNIKDYGEFTKATETVKVGNNTYDKLTTEVEGKTYTLLVDTDIKLFDAHSGGEII